MEALGEKLRLSREEKGLSIDRVARDTNIARRYLEGLENEDFDLFPGEPYLIGFLSNYSEYLGLEPKVIVSLYKNHKIQEQPIPMNELLQKKDIKPLLIGVISVAAAAVLGVGLYLIISAASGKIDQAEKPVNGTVSAAEDVITSVVEPVQDDAEIEGLMSFSGTGIMQDYGINQGIRFDAFGVNKNLVVEAVYADGTVKLQLPDETVILSISDEIQFKLSEDSEKEFSVVVNDIDTKKKIVNLYIKRGDDLSMVAGVNDAANDDPAVPDEIEAADIAEDVSDAPPASADNRAGTPRERAVIEVMTKDRPLPFEVIIKFDSACLFRYQVDGSDEKIENYFTKGKELKIEPRRNLVFGANNAGSFNLYVANRAVQVGQSGEVVVKKLAWRKLESKKYVLELLPVY